MDATILRSVQAKQCSRFLPSTYVGQTATLNWPRQSTDCACQSSEMAALLNSLSFVFKNLFLPKYCVKHYDYIVKWCSGVQCNWGVSLDIA